MRSTGSAPSALGSLDRPAGQGGCDLSRRARVASPEADIEHGADGEVDGMRVARRLAQRLGELLGGSAGSQQASSIDRVESPAATSDRAAVAVIGRSPGTTRRCAAARSAASGRLSNVHSWSRSGVGSEGAPLAEQARARRRSGNGCRRSRRCTPARRGNIADCASRPGQRPGSSSVAHVVRRALRPPAGRGLAADTGVAAPFDWTAC